MPDSAARAAFPKILKDYMGKNNLNQVDIANHLHVSKQTVSDWINGKKYPRVDKMQQLADLFGVYMSEMYSYEKVKRIEEHIDYSQEERELVAAYRLAEPSAQQYAFEILLNHPAIKKEDSAV